MTAIRVLHVDDDSDIREVVDASLGLEYFISLGAQGVLPKPFDPMTLAALVRSHVPLSAESR